MRVTCWKPAPSLCRRWLPTCGPTTECGRLISESDGYFIVPIGDDAQRPARTVTQVGSNDRTPHQHSENVGSQLPSLNQLYRLTIRPRLPTPEGREPCEP